MFIIVDWHNTEFFGPFETKYEAEEWLAIQHIYIGEYEDQEVQICSLFNKSASNLKEVKA